MANITINEVRKRLQAFAKEHENDSDEKQHAQQFWRDFYACFGLSKSSASMFEARVAKINGKRGYIDSFIPSLLLVEQKSLNRDLGEAYKQALDYALAIKDEEEKPRYIVTCDFQTFHLYDLHGTSKEPAICKLSELHKHADWFMFLADKKLETIVEETPINRKAAYQISKLHERLLEDNFVGKDLEVFLTRLLFCLFADDTGIFGEDGQFTKYIQNTRQDGSDTGSALATLFQVLNTAHDKRQTSLDERLNAFEYVNGSLFAERTEIPFFNTELRKILIECAKLDWSDISPAIFGAMFQAVLEENATDNKDRKETRRELGAHYTSERNILKVIQPLFLDGLWQEYEAAKNNKQKLTVLYDKLPTLTFFDPACGCGNFLVVAYRELRKLENEIIEQLFFKSGAGGLLDVATLCRVNVGQFYGIEIDEAAAHIARVAMYITDHQSNLLAASKFGATRATVPLITTPHIHCGNAISTKWDRVLHADKCAYVFGNPPFIGKKEQNDEQKNEVLALFKAVNGSGVLDYVCCWYALAANYVQENKSIKCAFVSTNSITQGEQVGILWSYLHSLNVNIDFAHRTFRWSNEGKGVAGVHCVIIGFSLNSNNKNKKLFFYDDIDGTARIENVSNINPYLVNAPFVAITKKSKPICNVAEMNYGSMPIDNNYFTLTKEERDEFINESADNEKLIRVYVGGNEFINNELRYCLWLHNADLNLINKSKLVKERIEAVRNFRLGSDRLATNKLANFPALFGEIRQPNTNYLLFPKVSSENRKFMPIGFMDASVIASGSALLIPNASLYDFGVLQSSMHMAWMRAVCGRLESRYQYSASVVYNNFIWATNVSEALMTNVSEAASKVLKARDDCGDVTLATMYNNLTMPPALVKAHIELDKAVDKAYGYKGADDDASRVAFLFKLYEQATSLLPSQDKVKTKRTKKVEAING
jgi:type I restriction-modification system DNA methylase subunit